MGGGAQTVIDTGTAPPLARLDHLIVPHHNLTVFGITGSEDLTVVVVDRAVARARRAGPAAAVWYLRTR
jgi:hypothetical protein